LKGLSHLPALEQELNNRNDLFKLHQRLSRWLERHAITFSNSLLPINSTFNCYDWKYVRLIFEKGKDRAKVLDRTDWNDRGGKVYIHI